MITKSYAERILPIRSAPQSKIPDVKWNRTEATATMASTTKAVFEYLEWSDLFNHEKPFQVLIDIPSNAPDQRRANCSFSEGEEELVEDVRDNVNQFSLDKHGFTYITHRTQLQGADFKDRKKVEELYLPECEDIIRQTLEDVDQVHFFNWLVSLRSRA
jgi:hypothetical protein